jgi:predicted RNase H-like nuclease
MASFLGVDGFRRGWVAAWIDDRGSHGFHYARTIDEVIAVPFDRAMIDIPIGIPIGGHRGCDREANKLLGPCVFSGIRRDIWDFETQQDANDHYRAQGETCITCQLWSIRTKIREVDIFMNPLRQAHIKETHPELIFLHLNGQSRLLGKKSPIGRERRVSLLKAQGFTNIERWLGQRRGTGIGRDDLIDACACAIAARDARQRLPRQPDAPDPTGLWMEMWF